MALLWAKTLANERIRNDLTPSICEEALDRFRKSEDSLAGIIRKHNIRVRDFMLLSVACDQEEIGIEQLGRALGLDPEEVRACVIRLDKAGLLRVDLDLLGTKDQSCFVTTAAGRLVARRIIDTIN